MTAPLTEEEVHGTTEPAAWLLEHLAAAAADPEIALDADIAAAYRMLLANYTVCRTRYAVRAEARGGIQLVLADYVALRQAALAVRLAAWSLRRLGGWKPEWLVGVVDDQRG